MLCDSDTQSAVINPFPTVSNRYRLATQLIFSVYLVLVVACVMPLTTLAQAYPYAHQEIQFSNVKDSIRLSQQSVTAIAQDKAGYMWIGNQNGLNRFNGISSKTYNFNPRDPNSLASDWIQDVFVDSEERIWVLGNGGISLYLPEIDGFRNLKDNPDFPAYMDSDFSVVTEDDSGNLYFGSRNHGIVRLSSDGRELTSYTEFADNWQQLGNEIYELTFDKQGNLWVATPAHGLSVLPANSNAFVSFTEDTAIPIPSDNIRMVFEDSQSQIWVATATKGVFTFDRQRGVQQHYTAGGKAGQFCHNSVHDIFEDQNNQLWFATDHGLCEYKPATQSFIAHRHSDLRSNSLIDDRVRTLYQDDGGVIWVGTESGLSRWNARLAKFPHVSRSQNLQMSSDVIASFAEDKQGNLYVGTWGGGINVFSADDQDITLINASEGVDGALQDERVLSLLVDSNNNLWVGTFNGGLHVRRNGRSDFEHFSDEYEGRYKLSSNSVSRIIELPNGDIVVATFGGGVNIIRQDGSISYIQHDETNANSISSDRVLDVAYDGENRLWIATRSAGVSTYDLSTGEVQRIAYEPGRSNSLVANNIASLLTSTTHTWVATQGSGLARIANADFNKGEINFELIGLKQGLPSLFTYGMLEDEFGYIWVSHTRGLSRIDPTSLNIDNFNTTHGLQGEDFNSGAYFKSASGRLFFGGSNGFNTFTPKNIPINQYHAPVRLTRFSIFGEEIPIEQIFSLNGSIELKHSDAFLEFEFAALDYTKPENNQFQYMMQGLRDEWVYSANNNRITFTNLPHGDYTFRIRGSNNDGVWSEQELKLPIRVTPPWWYSDYAYALYGLTLLMLAIVLKLRAQHKQRMHLAYQKQLEESVAERTEELQKANDALELAVVETKKARDVAEKAASTKSNFLATMSHEIRTPMNSIIGMSDLLLSAGLNRTQSRYALAVQKASQMLLDLINDMLDFSKLEADKIVLENELLNLHELIEETAFLFANRAHENGVELVVLIDPKTPEYITGDALRLRQIVTNLLSNAVKFTEQGYIEISCSVTAANIVISVKDTGIGIAEANQAKIFKAFRQEDSSTTRRFGGTGLGLAIISRLLKVMNGDIKVYSTPHQGATFTVRLPAVIGQDTPAVSANQCLPSAHQNIQVVVLSNSKDVRRMTMNMLQRLGIAAKAVDEPLHYVSELAVPANEQATSVSTVYLIDSPLLKHQCFINFVNQRDFCILLTDVVANNQVEVLVKNTVKSHVFCLPKPMRKQVTIEILQDCLSGNIKPEDDGFIDAIDKFDEFQARILLVEDVATNQEVATNMLHMFGCEVDIADNGQIALDMVKTNQYDLILMDCQMPVMDGFTATRAIRKWQQYMQLPRVPIVALTAGAGLGYEGKCREAGMDSHTFKPFSIEQLLLLLKQYLSHLKVQIESVDGDTDAEIVANARPNTSATASYQSDAASTIPTENNDLIDFQAINAIKEVESMTGKSIYDKVYTTFKREFSEKLPELEMAIANQNAEQTRTTAHAMKSLSANLGGKRLAKLCSQIERNASENNMSLCQDDFELLDDAYKQTNTILDDIAREVV